MATSSPLPATPSPPAFATDQQAIAWLVAQLQAEDETCIDNERFAFLDDAAALARYEQSRAGGCCGERDEVVVVAGRRASVGCNFGH